MAIETIPLSEVDKIFTQLQSEENIVLSRIFPPRYQYIISQIPDDQNYYTFPVRANNKDLKTTRFKMYVQLSSATVGDDIVLYKLENDNYIMVVNKWDEFPIGDNIYRLIFKRHCSVKSQTKEFKVETCLHNGTCRASFSVSVLVTTSLSIFNHDTKTIPRVMFEYILNNEVENAVTQNIIQEDIKLACGKVEKIINEGILIDIIDVCVLRQSFSNLDTDAICGVLLKTGSKELAIAQQNTVDNDYIYIQKLEMLEAKKQKFSELQSKINETSRIVNNWESKFKDVDQLLKTEYLGIFKNNNDVGSQAIFNVVLCATNPTIDAETISFKSELNLINIDILKCINEIKGQISSINEERGKYLIGRAAARDKHDDQIRALEIDRIKNENIIQAERERAEIAARAKELDNIEAARKRDHEERIAAFGLVSAVYSNTERDLQDPSIMALMDKILGSIPGQERKLQISVSGPLDKTTNKNIVDGNNNA